MVLFGGEARMLKYEAKRYCNIKKVTLCRENLSGSTLRAGVDHKKLKCLGRDEGPGPWLTWGQNLRKELEKSLVGEEWISIVHYKGKEDDGKTESQDS